MMGRYTYAAVPLRAYLISSTGHNILLIDGQGQNQRSLMQTWAQTAPRPTEWIAQGETKDPWVSNSILDVAYGRYEGPWTGGLQGISWQRWLYFHKPDPAAGRPAFWVVRDRVEGEGEHELTFLLHFFPGDVTTTPETGSIQTHFGPQGGNLIARFISSDGLALDAAIGQENPPRGWYSQEYGLIKPAWEVRASRKTGLPFEQAMVFVPYQGEQAPTVETIATPAGVKVIIDGQACEVEF